MRSGSLAVQILSGPCGAGGADSAGDGFERFVREQRAVLLGYLCRRMSEDDAQDIVQEAMVRLMRYAHLPDEQLRRLMYRIALNVMHDRGRREASHGGGQHVSLEDDHEVLASGDPSHEQRLDTQQQLGLVRNLILALPERCREVYLLNRIEGLSYSQIAERQAISVKAVEKHISRALKRLREGLAQAGAAYQESDHGR